MFSPKSLERKIELTNKLYFIEANIINNRNSALKLNLIDMPPMILRIQDGPYCPESCAHCYGGFGPTQPKASLKLYETLMEQIDDTDINEFILTDGEPFHDIGRLTEILRIIRGMPVELTTNGKFASSVESAKDVLTKIKDAGFSSKLQEERSTTRGTHSTISISADRYHKMNTFNQVINLAEAFQEVLAHEYTFEEMLKHGHYGIYHMAINYHENNYGNTLKNDKQFIEKLLAPFKERLHGGFIADKNSRVGYLISKKPYELCVAIVKGTIDPYGNALSFIKKDRKKLFKPSKLMLDMSSTQPLTLKSSGELYYAQEYNCLVPGRYMGNIFERPLKELIEETMKKTLYQMERVYGVRGIYNQLYIEGIRISADSHCGVCTQIFENAEKVKLLEEKLTPMWRRHKEKLHTEVQQ